MYLLLHVEAMTLPTMVPFVSDQVRANWGLGAKLNDMFAGDKHLWFVAHESSIPAHIMHTIMMTVQVACRLSVSHGLLRQLGL